MATPKDSPSIIIPDEVATPPPAPASFKEITDAFSVITPIEGGRTFPECIPERVEKYGAAVNLFAKLVAEASDSGALLASIRTPQIPGDTRMSLLKIFRRCVSPAADTEATKKIRTPTATFVKNLGHTFKPITTLRENFSKMDNVEKTSLCVLLGENDDRGKSGYVLTGLFFDWFNATHPDMTIDGPRGAGPDIELSKVFPEFTGSYPCDFVIRKASTGAVLAVGFARYDSSRGGSQSDDRTGGNENKVAKAIRFQETSGKEFKIIFLADGPGLAHGDTWREAQSLDGLWDGRVRVTTLKTASQRVSREWLLGIEKAP